MRSRDGNLDGSLQAGWSRAPGAGDRGHRRQGRRRQDQRRGQSGGRADGGRQAVVLLDGDLGLANVDVFLGLSPRYTLAHVLTGERTLDEILVTAPQGFQVVPAASGAANLANMDVRAHLGLVQAFSALATQVDVLIVDTAAGLGHGVTQFSQAAQQVVVTICDEPASLTDAYALVKVLSRHHGVSRFRVLTNMVRSPGSGRGPVSPL